LAQEFQDSANPLKGILGSDRVQPALQTVVDAKVGMNKERTSREAVQAFIQSCDTAIPALRSAVAACKGDGRYGANYDPEAGPAWAGTMLPSDGTQQPSHGSTQGGGIKPGTAWGGTTRPSG
jgi:hypothetical protein